MMNRNNDVRPFVGLEPLEDRLHLSATGQTLLAGPLAAAAAAITVQAAGQTWLVKTGQMGPGNNVWNADNVSVDQQGRLHLKITQVAGVWTCAEVYSSEFLRYGTTRIYVSGPIAGQVLPACA